MPDTPNGFVDNNDLPTEELYIELRDLEAIETRGADSSVTSESSHETGESDDSQIRERIAHLRALLAHRGVIQD